MRTHLHRWLPTVIALLALVVALDGPATAKNLINGKHIKKGTVATKQLKDGSITGKDVRLGSLTGAQVADGSLTSPDLANGGVTSEDLADGGVNGVDLKDGAVGAVDLSAAAVGSANLAEGAVTATKVGRGALKGAAFDAAGTVAIDFGTVAAHSCVSSPGISVPASQIADGTLDDDVMVMTPGAFFAFNFSWTVKVEGSTVAYIKMCNVGDTSADPDAGGGAKSWRYLAIDIS